jgi:hypothetical protein
MRVAGKVALKPMTPNNPSTIPNREGVSRLPGKREFNRDSSRERRAPRGRGDDALGMFTGSLFIAGSALARALNKALQYRTII